MTQSTLLSTSYIYDVADITELDVKSKEFKELIIRLVMNANKQNLAINGKETGIYDVLETVTGQTFPPVAGRIGQRAGYRICMFDFGALPNTATKTLAHGITLTPNLMSTNYWGMSADPLTNTYLKLPYASPVLANNIELNITGANIVVTTGSDRTAFTKTYIFIEYLKD
jgi:hypothetical protein